MSAYDDLMARERETQALAQVAGRLGWDQETMMPRGAADQRAEESGAMQAVLHARRVDPARGDVLAEAEGQATEPVARAQLRHIRRDYERAVKVPGDLAVALARLTSRAQGQWAEARAADDYAAFAPVLAEVVRLKREEAAALSAGGTLYDALLEDYEPGMSAAKLDAMFAEMRPRLVALRGAALAVEWPKLEGRFDRDVQLALSQDLAQVFGYDLSRGRLDLAVHPFSSGSGDDVRITTRVSEADPFNCFYSTIHEVGHACYEQGIDPAYRLTPLGQGVSMGVHESQSRIYENQLGRSRAFCGWLYGRMRDGFGDFGIADEETFYRAVNRVHRGYIRTEADEVQYNLHVMLRYDLERALIAGDLSVADLEAAWNDRFAADFGYAVDCASHGVLQDVHWSVGLFGYFPTYSLGNLYAGCLFEALQAAVPGLGAQLARGELAEATTWLRGAVQRHGGLFEPAEVIARACGAAPTAGPLLDYLDRKFGDLAG
ncbi:Thermostable carboxypeptidase 1 [Roseovarius sp. EC-HK134]|uniref:carboxypeptidase M32 n=1 Tax=unclassified Roseovarius TaxID=2614913 RepID=UPI0012553697|nr:MULTISPECIES: carboxypeptidase M32 [unclassified Roseovarius]VVT25885.1 Thermostable carboxypeptidase 1 [Roseovarius sp. EC-HK134]VVT26050.1 Thermostable carboxypeptidase 1 [Roseovarius sp. EC-SD190]